MHFGVNKQREQSLFWFASRFLEGRKPLEIASRQRFKAGKNLDVSQRRPCSTWA